MLKASAAVIALCLVGCNNSNSLDGQIEKCAQAQIEADTESNQRLEAQNLAEFGPDWRVKALEKARGPWTPYGPKIVRSKADIEAYARLICLQVAAGKSK